VRECLGARPALPSLALSGDARVLPRGPVLVVAAAVGACPSQRDGAHVLGCVAGGCYLWYMLWLDPRCLVSPAWRTHARPLSRQPQRCAGGGLGALLVNAVMHPGVPQTHACQHRERRAHWPGLQVSRSSAPLARGRLGQASLRADGMELIETHTTPSTLRSGRTREIIVDGARQKAHCWDAALFAPRRVRGRRVCVCCLAVQRLVYARGVMDRSSSHPELDGRNMGAWYFAHCGVGKVQVTGRPLPPPETGAQHAIVHSHANWAIAGPLTRTPRVLGRGRGMPGGDTPLPGQILGL
jgi:hypothetical protein